MSYGSWKPYVPVAKRRAQAEKAAARAKKAGQTMQPVLITGRAIATTFWGRAWCDNLEAYSDFANRLPRGRTYARNGSVIDLAIEPGAVRARVAGSQLYTIEIGIAPVSDTHWNALVQGCAGSIASLVGLLQGHFPKAVMEHLCQPGTGLFPAPKDIHFHCSCPDWAAMCKHVAATLYGVGARLDAQPELLFTLRRRDATDLVTEAARQPAKTPQAPARGKLLEDSCLADVFGIEMDPTAAWPDTRKTTTTRRTRRRETAHHQIKTAMRMQPKKTRATPAGKKEATVTKPGFAKGGNVRPDKSGKAAQAGGRSALGKGTARQTAASISTARKKRKTQT